MWQDFVGWLQSSAGARVLQTAIIPVLAIVVAAVVAALIARAAVRASVRRSERVEASSAIGALVAAASVGAGSDDEYVRRLRAEADVRTRLLPLPGAGMAADWAAARLDAVQPGSTTRAGTDELRDRLVEWVGKPSKAKRLFAAPQTKPAPPVRPEATEQKATEPEAPTVERADAPADVKEAEPERFARPVVAAHRTPAPEPEAPAAVAAPSPAAEVSTTPAAVPAGVASAAAVAQPAAEVPAWQRTRAGERLQQERTRPRTAEPAPADEDDAVPLSTAPVQLAQAHRAQAASAAESEEAVRLEAVRLEAHQQARHARPDQAPAAAAKGPAPAATPAPAWLDTYDDEAQVTQNLDLKTPPPVAAAAIRDRGAPGEDLVPRS